MKNVYRLSSFKRCYEEKRLPFFTYLGLFGSDRKRSHFFENWPNLGLLSGPYRWGRRRKNGFYTRQGKFEFLTIFFGFLNVFATFQIIINRILRPFFNVFVIIYLDNILIFSDTKNEYAEYLAKVLEIL
jgi:hypothetical protein